MGASPRTQQRHAAERARRVVQEPTAEVEPPARDRYWSLLNQVWAILSDLDRPVSQYGFDAYELMHRNGFRRDG
jgi:hypothetical protein